MNRDEKRQQVDDLHQELERAQSVLMSTFQGLTVASDTDLRRKIAQCGAKYKVVKNTLIERAAKGTSAEPIAQNLRGTTSIAYTETDPVSLAKALTAYAKENPTLVFKTGVVEGRVVSLADLGAIANLPSREVLLGKALFLIKASGARLASSIAGVGRNLAVVIQQGVKENKFQDKKDNPSNSAEFRSLKEMIDRKLQVGRDRKERELAAKMVIDDTGADPCNLDKVLPTLGGVGVGRSRHLLARPLYDGLADSEKDEMKTYYQVECAKLRSEFPELFAQKPASN